MTIHPPRSVHAFFWVGVTLFVLPGALCTYLLMPFPGSQTLDVFALSYHLHQMVFPLELFGVALMIFPVIETFRHGTRWGRFRTILTVVLCGVIFFFTQIEMTAEKMFREPKHVTFTRGDANHITPETLVLGVAMNGVAKAYPVRFLAFHHKVHDTIGSQPILVTYCTMCRTGRVYDPVIDGRVQTFRLVGARQYNAIIEDNETKSWWYQATGEAMIGPRTGMLLAEIPSEEMTLKAWSALHPGTVVFQADPESADGYAMFSFDKWDSARPPRPYLDSSIYTWKQRNWVVGLIAGKNAKAFAWSGVIHERVVNDSLADVPVTVAVESDSISFHAWNRTVHGTVLSFVPGDSCAMRDSETRSMWNWSGTCIAGPLAGQSLTPMRAYREYWHSWKTFHPATTQWETRGLL